MRKDSPEGQGSRPPSGVPRATLLSNKREQWLTGYSTINVIIWHSHRMFTCRMMLKNPESLQEHRVYSWSLLVFLFFSLPSILDRTINPTLRKTKTSWDEKHN
ncbi:hypothetical protein NPIL_367511 [Nephila pilipes]|uniref:Uncharacterized protein n=1 Tax=Nephila pilipes TaxID=299642 RepID=A0A8X6Q0Q1_NEPPI|nr:hypothetical protein NPIL_367511 [Nephila pilipes]